MDSMDESQHGRSLWRGVLFATLASPVALLLFVLLMTPRIASADRLLQGIFVIMVVTMPIAFLATTLLGLPAILLLRWKKWLNWPSVCGGAMLVAMLANAFVVGVMSGRWASMGQTAVTAFIGLVAGIAFCLGAKVAHRATIKAQPDEIG